MHEITSNTGRTLEDGEGIVQDYLDKGPSRCHRIGIVCNLMDADSCPTLSTGYLDDASIGNVRRKSNFRDSGSITYHCV